MNFKHEETAIYVDLFDRFCANFLGMQKVFNLVFSLKNYNTTVQNKTESTP